MFEPKRNYIKSRREFERNLYLLSEYISRGKLHISRSVEGLSGLEKGLKSAGYLPNRRIDFISINESVRLMANTISNQSLYKDLANEE